MRQITTMRMNEVEIKFMNNLTTLAGCKTRTDLMKYAMTRLYEDMTGSVADCPFVADLAYVRGSK